MNKADSIAKKILEEIKKREIARKELAIKVINEIKRRMKNA